MKRALITAASILALGVGFAPAVAAAPSAANLPTFDTLGQCREDANIRTAAAGGPGSGVYYYCEEVGSVPNGVAGCPPPTPTNNDGCLGRYWTVKKNSA